MKRFDFRTILGAGLILLGGLLLLEQMNIIGGASDLFWGAAFLVGAAYFLYVFAQNPHGAWWAIIPGMALLGLGGNVLLPSSLSAFDGGIFLGALGLAFFIVYITDHSRWWGIIPGGVLLTLAVIATLEDMSGLDSGGLLFIGLGFTFLLVALLPNPVGKMQWAYIPAVVLVLMGGLLGSQATAGLAGYVWPAALIFTGLLVLGGFFWGKNRE